MSYQNENAQMERPWTVFDVETMPMSDCADYLTDPIEAPANYKDPTKITAYIAEKRTEQIGRAALDPDLCEIAAIAIADSDTRPSVRSRLHDWSERALLEWFWRETREQTLVGFNCVGFDLPVLLRRSLYLNVLTPHVSIDRYRHPDVVDVLDLLTYSGKLKCHSLSFYCKRFGIPHGDCVSGAEIPALAAAGQWDAVEQHCLDDVNATVALALRIGAIYLPKDGK